MAASPRSTYGQRTVALIGATIVAVLLLFPPWTFLGEFDGYRPLWSPPAFGESVNGHIGGVTGGIAWVQWLIPIAFVIGATFAAFRYLGARNKRPE